MRPALLLILLLVATVGAPPTHACLCNNACPLPKAEMEAIKPEMLSRTDAIVAGFVTEIEYDAESPLPSRSKTFESSSSDSVPSMADRIVTWTRIRILPIGYAKGRDLGGADIWLAGGTSCDADTYWLDFVALEVRNEGDVHVSSHSFCHCTTEAFFPKLKYLHDYPKWVWLALVGAAIIAIAAALLLIRLAFRRTPQQGS